MFYILVVQYTHLRSRLISTIEVHTKGDNMNKLIFDEFIVFSAIFLTFTLSDRYVIKSHVHDVTK